MILRDLMSAIKAAISSTDTESKKTFVQWLQMCRDAEKGYMDQLDAGHRAFTAQTEQVNKLRAALSNFGNHVVDCASIQVEGRTALRWFPEDSKTCSCGLAKEFI